MKSTIDWFVSDVSGTEIEVSDELFEKLVDHALAFLKGGGVLTWERWALLGDASRKAFVEAGETLKAQRALEMTKP